MPTTVGDWLAWGLYGAAFAAATLGSAMVSSMAEDSRPEISIRSSRLLWGEQGVAFGDVTFANVPLLGTATAIILDCEFLDGEGHKVDQRRLTLAEPLHGRTIRTVRVRIGSMSREARKMTCSVADFTWTRLGKTDGT